MASLRALRSEPPLLLQNRAASPKYQRGIERVPELDLTESGAGDSLLGRAELLGQGLGGGMKFVRSGSLAAARRRVWAQRERRVERGRPEVVVERLGVEAEDPGAARERAEWGRRWTHVWRTYLVVGYAHAAVALALTVVLLWGLAMFAWAVRADVARKVRARVGEARKEARKCQEMWARVGCGSRDMEPSLKEMCAEWEICEEKGKWAAMDGHSATVWAEVVAETVNAFTSKISSSSVVVALILLLAAALLVSVTSWGFMHGRVAQEAAGQQACMQETGYSPSCHQSPRVQKRLSFSPNISSMNK